MTSVRAENFFPQYLGINISFSHLYRISKTNSCHKCATALKPAKKKERYAFHRVGRGEEGGGGRGKGRGGEGVEEEEEGEVEDRKREEEEEEGVEGWRGEEEGRGGGGGGGGGGGRG